MSELKIVKKSVKVEVGEKAYIVSKPTSRQIKDFADKKDNSIDATIALLDTLGLPAKVAWDIDADSLSDIVKALMPSSEKKS